MIFYLRTLMLMVIDQLRQNFSICHWNFSEIVQLSHHFWWRLRLYSSGNVRLCTDLISYYFLQCTLIQYYNNWRGLELMLVQFLHLFYFYFCCFSCWGLIFHLIWSFCFLFIHSITFFSFQFFRTISNSFFIKIFFSS